MKYLLDTSTCIHYLNQKNTAVRARLEVLRPADIALCAVVKAELFYGAFKSQRPEETLAAVERFCAAFASLPFTDRTAQIAGELRATLDRRGEPIGPYDLLIAATAAEHNLTLVSANVKEFERVAGLRIENWMAS
ncbi:MAG: type II toxin-antitoxin system VapC family toxin [Planctomycetes bacterium]|nr:type II toxin-antitoxin system VapC family toxin [Planctomycetota bacterium]